MNGKVIVEIRRADKGYRVVDGQRREHQADDEASLGALIEQLLDDSSMPPVEELEFDPAISVAIGILGRVIPRYRSFVLAAEPLAQQLAPHLRRK